MKTWPQNPNAKACRDFFSDSPADDRRFSVRTIGDRRIITTDECFTT